MRVDVSICKESVCKVRECWNVVKFGEDDVLDCLKSVSRE